MNILGVIQKLVNFRDSATDFNKALADREAGPVGSQARWSEVER